MKQKKGSLFAEFRRLSGNRMALLSVAGLLVIPLMYSGMLLGAFWDPYGKLDRLPVAVVNEDRGAAMDGKPVDTGGELVDELKRHPDFQWKFTGREDAMAGLREHRYAMAFVIPEDFSARTTTLKEETPRPAQLQYYVDDGWNYLNSRIGEEAADRLRADVSRSVTRAYAQAVLDSVSAAADGLKEAGDGAAQLADGARKAGEGAERLRDNLVKLADGSILLEQGFGRLKDGASALAAGSQEASAGAAALRDGLDQLTDAENNLADGIGRSAAGAEDLAAGTGRLAAGAESLAAGAGKLEAGGGAAASGAERLAQGLESFAGAHPELAGDETFGKLIETAKELSAGAGELGEGAADLHQAAQELTSAHRRAADGAIELKEGLWRLQGGFGEFGGKLKEASDGAKRLADGTAQVASGAGRLQDGIADTGKGFRTVADGTAQLAGGSRELAGGVGEITDGSRELSDKLGDAAADAGGLSGGEQMADMFAEPVSVAEHKFAGVPNYGTGMTPYFLSLGLYVGALLSTVILPLRDNAGGVTGGFRRYLSKLLVFMPVVLIQTILVDAVLLYAMGLKVPDPALFFTVTALIAVTFMTILQFLISLADQIGRFLGVALLTLQLASSAGTYPAELLPGWMQAVSPWMPMTHAIRALRLVIEGAPLSDIVQPLYMLATCAVIFAGLTILYFVWKSRREQQGPQLRANLPAAAE